MSDERFMRRAIEIALTNLGKTAPNPVVGCVIVRDGVVLSEAATAPGGRPHAEEQALQGIAARGAVAYVTLEPCGARSTGAASCAQRLVEGGVDRVVIAAKVGKTGAASSAAGVAAQAKAGAANRGAA